MSGRLGVVTLVALSLVLAALSAEDVEVDAASGSGSGQGECPQSERTFTDRMRSCYKGLNFRSPVVDKAEKCRQTKSIVECWKRWISRCSGRSWSAKYRADIDHTLRVGQDAVRKACSAA